MSQPAPISFLPASIAGNLQNRSVLIFGGTSGIGFAAARQAKAAGASVIVVGFDAAGAERVAAEHGFAGWRAADVTNLDTITTALADIPHSRTAANAVGADVEAMARRSRPAPATAAAC